MKIYRSRSRTSRSRNSRSRNTRSRTNRSRTNRSRRIKMGGSEIKTITVQQPDGTNFDVEYDDDPDVYYNNILTHPSNRNKNHLKHGTYVIIGDGEYRVKIVHRIVRDQIQAEIRAGLENIMNTI